MSRKIGAVGLAAFVVVAALLAANRDFIPDASFKGSSLHGWQALGQTEWRADKGEIVANPKGAGGWLILDKSYQDIQFYSSFRCSGPCKTGVLLRAEKTPEGGMKGVYVSLNDGEAGCYDLVVNAGGEEVSRTVLEPAPAPLIHMAAAPSTAGQEAVPGFAKPASTPAEREAEHTQPATAPASGANQARAPRRSCNAGLLLAGDWNRLQIILDADLVGLSLNERRAGVNGVTTDRMMGFGPIALYAGGTDEVRFKEVSYKDLNPKFEPQEKVSPHFRMQRISDFYYGWCAAAADINKDGVLDVIAGPFYYLGPDYTERREFTAARTYNPSNQFSQGMVNFAYDFTGDGWPDILMVDQRPVYLYVNPRGESRRWDRYNIIPDAESEIELLKDIDGDGKPEVLFTGPGGVMSYAKPGSSNPTARWSVRKISEPGLAGAHGMGVGDINGDGRMDVVNNRGWWEQPTSQSAEGTWRFHPESFGNGGAEMGIYDVNGDGLNDVVTAIAAHGWGLAWFEQKRDAKGAISFVRHHIMGDFSTENAGGVTFSEPHAVIFADLDGDGIPDMIAGKRLYSHLESHLDPDPYGPAVLYWYRTVRNPKADGGAEFVPELIHNRSGVGSHFAAVDLNHDGAPDIVTSTNKGTFIFWNEMDSHRKSASTK